VTPHINDKDQIRLEIQEEISEAGAAQGTLGVVPITQRRANTTTIVEDQQTVVIGGLMREATQKTKNKIPVLGDLPVLGFLFRNSKTSTKKTNLILIMTPYVIRDQSDLRKVFERKMQERQEFLDRYFVFERDWEPPRDYTRTTGLVEVIRQSYFDLIERIRLEADAAPKEIREHTPSEPIDLPAGVKGSTAPGAAPAPAAPATPRRRRPRPTGDNSSPITITPIARSVTPEQGVDN